MFCASSPETPLSGGNAERPSSTAHNRTQNIGAAASTCSIALVKAAETSWMQELAISVSFASRASPFGRT